MRKLFRLLPVLMLLLLPVNVFALGTYGGAPRLNDEADLLTPSEEAEVLNALDTVSEKYYMDICVATVNGRTGDIVSFADDYYDARYGEDGVMLLIDMSDRSWYISTAGEGITAFTDEGIDMAGDAVIDYLSDGDFKGAFLRFADVADYYIESERRGNQIDYRDEPRDPMPVVPFAVVSIAVGVAVAFGYGNSLKGQLKTVRNQFAATGYAETGSLHLIDNRDNFIYSNVTKTRIESSSSTSSSHSSHTHSSTHHSSSGRSHGGGGGHF